MAKVPVTDDSIPHGLEGYRLGCKCAVCRGAWAEYHRTRRRAQATPEAKEAKDELAAKRAKVRTVLRKRQRTESNDSVRHGRKIGPMERAVIDECAKLPLAQDRPTVVVAACNLARMVDDLSGSSKAAAVQVSTTKQLMAMIESLRPKASTNKRKSGGRLATVGALTKVNRA